MRKLTSPHRQNRDEKRQHQRKKRSDSGTLRMNDRDKSILPWIGQQYAVRLDHVQFLLGRLPGRGAQYTDWISEGAARDVVKRWLRAGWIEQTKIHLKEPFWIYLSRFGLKIAGLPYKPYALRQDTETKQLRHLHALNEIRLEIEDSMPGTTWISERHLRLGLMREKGTHFHHLPDGEIHDTDGDIIAVEAELHAKTTFALEEILLKLIKGETYSQMQQIYGHHIARQMCHSYHSKYTEIWYFATEEAANKVRRVRRSLLQQGLLSFDEAKEIHVYSYPLIPPVEDEREDEQSLEDV